MMQKKNIAVLCGGFTAERNISLGSGEVVMKNLESSLFQTYKVLVNEDHWIVDGYNIPVNLNDFSFTINNLHVKFDCAFIAIHGSPGEDGKLQGYFDLKKIPYTNCGVAASSITFNKNYCKSLLKGIHINMAKGMLIHKNDSLENNIKTLNDEMKFPVFVKPNNNGSSYGVSKINRASELAAAIHDSFQYDSEILIEEGVIGREFTCGVYTYQNEIIVLPVCEIKTGKHDFFDYTAKYTSGESDEVIPAEISPEVSKRIGDISTSIYQYLSCKGCVRIDYMMDEKGALYFLEVNTVPGLSEASIVPKMAKASGLSLTEFFTRLISESISSYNLQ